MIIKGEDRKAKGKKEQNKGKTLFERRTRQKGTKLLERGPKGEEMKGTYQLRLCRCDFARKVVEKLRDDLFALQGARLLGALLELGDNLLVQL